MDMTEKEFQDAIVDLAHTFDWRAFHARAAGTNKGWRTPVAYDGKGYTDLTLIHDKGFIIFAEIKKEKNPAEYTDEQRAWGERIDLASAAINRDLRDASPARVFYRLWRPRHGDEIATLLSFGRVTEWTP